MPVHSLETEWNDKSYYKSLSLVPVNTVISLMFICPQF